MEPKNLNEWWAEQPEGLKQAFTLFPDELWEGADLYLRINIRNYCCLKKTGYCLKAKSVRCLSRLSANWRKWNYAGSTE